MNDAEFLKLVNEFTDSLKGRMPEVSDVKSFFGGELDSAQTDAVIAYVKEKQAQEDGDNEYVRSYTESLPDISDLSGRLLRDMSFEDIIRGHQHHVIDAAAGLMEDGFDLSDLIAEGNLALVEIAAELTEMFSDDSCRDNGEIYGDENGEIFGRIMKALNDGISGFISMSKTLADSDDKLVEQANLLNSTIDRMIEENGVKPNVDELANELGIPQHRVLDIIELAGKDREDK